MQARASSWAWRAGVWDGPAPQGGMGRAANSHLNVQEHTQAGPR